MFTKAIDWGFASKNPVKKVKLYSEDGRQCWRILTQDEISSLLNNCGSPLKEIILIALNTGMRMGDILSLKWDDIDFQNEYILVRHSKSGRSRKVPLNRISLKALLNLKELNGKFAYVFYNHKSRSNIKCPRTAFKTACKKSGIYSLRFHDLRHCAATFMVQSGVDIPTVSKILGHSDITLTMRYSHPSFDHTKDGVKVLEKIFDQRDAVQEKSDANLTQSEKQSNLIH